MLTRWQTTLLALFCALGAFGTGLAGAQQYRKVESLSATSLNETVEVEGTVSRWVAGLGGNFYLLRTNWGEEILVRTSRALPAIDKRYQVRGVVTEQQGRRFISEEELRLVTEETTRETETSGAAVKVQVPRVEMGQSPGYAAPHEATSTEGSLLPVSGGSPVPPMPASGGSPGRSIVPTTYLPWLVAGAGVVAIAVALGMMARRKRPVTADVSVGLASSPVAMAPVAGAEPLTPPRSPVPEPQGVTGTTVKIHRPPAGTLKVLPGRFEVAAGESELKEIRFYKVPTQPVPEVTFGRLAGAPYTHVQLNSPTVSGRQAKLTFQDGRWVLTNFAPQTSNPTRVNGRELGVDESVPLRDGDRVEMGEVALVFHER